MEAWRRLVLVMIALIAGCAPAADDVGTVELPLAVQSEDGARYRLADFAITITGPDSRVLHDDGRDVIRAVLRAGDYSASLSPEFHLYRTAPGSSTEELVDMTRALDPTQSFTITPRGTTPVLFHFLADLGRPRGRTDNGVLEIGARVRPVGHLAGTARIDTVRGAAAEPLAGATIDLDGEFVVRSRLDIDRGGAVDSFIRFDELVMSSVGDPTGMFDDRFTRDFRGLIVTADPPGGRAIDPMSAPPAPVPPSTDGTPHPFWIYADGGAPITLRSSTRVLRIFPATIDPPRLRDGRLAGLDFTIETRFEITLDPGTSEEASVAGVVVLDSEIGFDPALIPPTAHIVEPASFAHLDAENAIPVHFLAEASTPPALSGWNQYRNGSSTPIGYGLDIERDSDDLCVGIQEEGNVKSTGFFFFAAWGELHDNYDSNNPYTPVDEEAADQNFPYDDYDYAVWDWRAGACFDD